jgi:hypothetical protein
MNTSGLSEYACSDHTAFLQGASRRMVKHSAVHPGGDIKNNEIVPPGLLRGSIRIVKYKIVRKSFPNPGELPKPGLVFAVADCQVKQLERTIKCPAAVIDVPFFSPNDRSFYFTSDIGHLFHKRQFQPTTCSVLFMFEGHRTNLSITDMIFLRISGFSTPLLRFPCDGRRLIIESNSWMEGKIGVFIDENKKNTVPCPQASGTVCGNADN